MADKPDAVQRARLHLRCADDAVDAAGAEVAQVRLSPQAQDELAAELAALMGKIERLLSALRHKGGQD